MKKIIILIALVLIAAQVSAFPHVTLNVPFSSGKMSIPEGYSLNVRELEKEINQEFTSYKRNPSSLMKITKNYFIYTVSDDHYKVIGFLWVYIATGIDRVNVWITSSNGRKYVYKKHLNFSAHSYYISKPTINGTLFPTQTPSKVQTNPSGAWTEPIDPTPPQTTPQTSFKSTSVSAGKTVFKRIPTSRIIYRKAVNRNPIPNYKNGSIPNSTITAGNKYNFFRRKV